MRQIALITVLVLQWLVQYALGQVAPDIAIEFVAAVYQLVLVDLLLLLLHVVRE